MKKEMQKKLSFVLFVMAVFFAGVALTAFSSSVLLICIAGVLLLATSVFYALQQGEKEPTPTEKTTEVLMADRMAELMRGNEKAEKGVYIAVKKQHEAMENGMAALEEKITELVKAQESAVKTLVLYNKENAKQLALSEREELERLSGELKQLSLKSDEVMLSELGSTVDSLNEIKELLKNLNKNRPVQYEVRPTMAAVEEDFSEETLFPVEELTEEYMPEAVEEPEELPEPAIEPVVADDPNRMLSADDIAALFAQANTETEAEPESVAEEKPEDAFTSSGVDLSDPNRTLSADDIAALVASLGH